jgi:hypothetical protein
MESKIYSDYVAYEINNYYHEHPYGPNRCPMCGGDLPQLDIEPSRAMREEMENATRNNDGFYVNSSGSFLHPCSRCGWWCVRDACQYVNTDVIVFTYRDYLIFAVAEGGKRQTPRDTPESAQPWLKALNDPDVYHERVLRRLPQELAGFIYKQPEPPEGAASSQPVIRDMSECDRFFEKTKELIVKRKEQQLHRIEHMRLDPGDKVRITEHAYGRPNETLPDTIVATKGSTATVLSYDEYYEHIHQTYGTEFKSEWESYLVDKNDTWLAWHFPQVKKWIDEETHYPIRLETVVPPSEDELTFWRELYWHPHLEWAFRKLETTKVLEVGCLEKIV